MNPNEVVDVLKKMKWNMEYDEYDALDHAIRCVEENEKLKQEIENLKYKNNYLSECAIEEEQRLKEALRKCSPYVYIRCTPCLFCRVPEGNRHTDDCEYVRLTGGAE